MQETCQVRSSEVGAPAEAGRFAVIGAGPGGLATAARLAEQGCDVGVHDVDPERIAPVRARGGVELEGDLGERFTPLARASTALEEIAAGAEVFLVAVSAFDQADVLAGLLDHLRPGATLVFMAGCAGTLAAAPVLRAAGLAPGELLLGETATHPFATRLTGPGRVRIRFPSRMRTAAFPARDTPRLVERLGALLPMTPTANVLDPALNNPNFLIHPAPMVLNYGDVERTDWTLSIMNEGMTPATLRLLDAVDAEKTALQAALGLEVVTIDDFYTRAGSGPGVYREPGEPFRLRDRIWERYVTEDIPYGTVLYASLGAALGVPTPVSDACNAILSVAFGRDFLAEGRTLQALGMGGMDRDAIAAYLEHGAGGGR